MFNPLSLYLAYSGPSCRHNPLSIPCMGRGSLTDFSSRITVAAPPGSSLVYRIFVQVRYYLLQTWMGVSILVKSIVAFPFVSGADMQLKIDSLGRFRQQLEGCDPANQLQKQQLLQTYRALPPICHRGVSYLSDQALLDFVNATNPTEAQNTKERLVGECSFIAGTQGRLLSVKAFFFRIPAPPPILPQNIDPNFRGLDMAQCPADLLPVGEGASISAAELQQAANVLVKYRGFVIYGMGCVLPDEFVDPDDAADPNADTFKDKFACPIRMALMMIPVFHEDNPVEGRQEASAMVRHAIENGHNTCSLCRAQVTMNTIQVDLQMQRQIFQKAAQGLAGMSDAQITARLPAVVAQFQRDEQLNRGHAIARLQAEIQKFPVQVNGANLRARFLGIFANVFPNP